MPANVPPQLAEYHLQTPPEPKLPPLTLSVVEPPAQIVVVPVIDVGATLYVFTTT